jgi:hypothetical protein
MATIASKENVNNQPCEFHQTNNLIYIYILMKYTKMSELLHDYLT